MKLQIALDFDFDTKTSARLLKQVVEQVDIIEIGTPYIMEHGLEAVRETKTAFPQKAVLADLKIVDAGYYEAKAAFAAGADIVTVLAVSDDATILKAKEAASEYGRAIMVDMLSVADLPLRIGQIDALGVDYICLHTSKDLQKLHTDAASAFEVLRSQVKRTKLALAGGINEANVESYAAIRPDVIIVGEGIAAASDPHRTASAIKTVIERCENAR